MMPADAAFPMPVTLRHAADADDVALAFDAMLFHAPPPDIFADISLTVDAAACACLPPFAYR